MDQDWHALRRVEGAEWEDLYCKFVEMNTDVNARHPSGSSKAERLWKSDAKEVTRTTITPASRSFYIGTRFDRKCGTSFAEVGGG